MNDICGAGRVRDEGCDIYAVTFYMIPPTQQLTQLPPPLSTH